MRFLVGFLGVGRVFSGTHKPMAGAIIGDRFVHLPSRLHLFNGLGHAGGYSGIVPSVEAVDWTGNPRQRVLLRWRSVKRKGSLEAWPIGCKSERLAAAPTEPRYG